MANQPQQQQPMLKPLFVTKNPGADAIACAKEHGFEVRHAYPGRPWSVNSHGDLAVERAICEMYVYDRIGQGISYLVDIGGRAQRWQINLVGSSVWTVQPKLCSSDNPYDIDRIGCSHRWSQCDCVDDPNGLIAVHSIYHLTPFEVSKAACAAADNSTHFYSIEHNFLDDEDRIIRKGVLGSAEFECIGVRSSLGTKAGWAVRFKSDERYNHPLPSFLMGTGDVIPKATCCGKHKHLSVSRSFVHRVGSTSVYEYKFSRASQLPLEVGTSIDVCHDKFDTYEKQTNMIGSSLTVPIPAGVSSRLGLSAHGHLCESVDTCLSYMPFVSSWTSRNWVLWFLAAQREFVDETIVVPQRLFDAVSARRVVTQDDEVLRGMVANFLAAQPANNYHTQEVLGEAVLRVADNKQVVVRERIGKTTSVSRLTTILSLIAVLSLLLTGVYYSYQIIGLIYYLVWAIDGINSEYAGRRLLSVQSEDPNEGIYWLMIIPLMALFVTVVLARKRIRQCVRPFWNQFKTTKLHNFGIVYVQSLANDYVHLRPRPILFQKMEFDNGTLPQLIAGKRATGDLEPALNPSKPSYYQATGPVLAAPVVVMSGSATNINYAIAGRIIVPVRGYSDRSDFPLPGYWAVNQGVVRYGTAWDCIVYLMCNPNCPFFWGKQAMGTPQVLPVDCNEWINSRPTKKQRSRYLDAKARLDLYGGPKGIRGFNSRTVFAKIEKTFDATKLPRAIVGATDEYQVCCGPEVSRTSLELHNWTQLCDRGVRIRWTEGWTSSQLTQEFNDAYARATATQYRRNVVFLSVLAGSSIVLNDIDAFMGSITVFVLGDDNLTVYRDPFDDQVKLIVNDLSKFDCTHSSQSWRAAKQFYKLLGMKESVVKLLEKANDLHGKTIKGGYFRSKWNMPSGNPDTCLRNSLINAMYTVTWFYMRMELWGADLPVVGPSVFSLETFIKATGFEPKLRVETDVTRVDFLSGIFLARDDGTGFEWVPKVFRLIHRLCYSVDSRVDPIEYNRAVAECYRAWDAVPVLREWVAATLRRNVCKDSKLIEQIKLEQTLYKLRPMAVKPVRASFMARYGLTANGLSELQQLMDVAAGLPMVSRNALFEACLSIDL